MDPIEVPCEQSSQSKNIDDALTTKREDSSNGLTRIELNCRQATCLLRRLPKCYSLQVDSKPVRRVPTAARNKDKDKYEIKKKDKPVVEDISYPLRYHKSTSGRVSKASTQKYSEENDNAVYEKYTNIFQKYPKRNTYEGISESLRPCVKILSSLKSSRTSWPFRYPVDSVALSIPHYNDIVKYPMDLSKVYNNLRTNQYLTPTQFHADINKIIKNSYLFNEHNACFIKVTQYFEDYYKKITTYPTQLDRGNSNYSEQADRYVVKEKSVPVKKKKSYTIYRYPNEYQLITLAEKKYLVANIKKLTKEQMKSLMEIVNQNKTKAVLYIDLKDEYPAMIRKLQHFVREKLMELKQFDREHPEDRESSFEINEEEDS